MFTYSPNKNHMKNTIFTMLFSLLLIGVGVCFVVDDVKADPVPLEQVSHFDVTIAAEAIATPDHVPLVDSQHALINLDTEKAIVEKPIADQNRFAERYSYRSWRDNSDTGKTHAGYRRQTEKYALYAFKISINRTPERRC